MARISNMRENGTIAIFFKTTEFFEEYFCFDLTYSQPTKKATKTTSTKSLAVSLQALGSELAQRILSQNSRSGDYELNSMTSYIIFVVKHFCLISIITTFQICTQAAMET